MFLVYIEHIRSLTPSTLVLTYCAYSGLTGAPNLIAAIPHASLITRAYNGSYFFLFAAELIEKKGLMKPEIQVGSPDAMRLPQQPNILSTATTRWGSIWEFLVAIVRHMVSPPLMAGEKYASNATGRRRWHSIGKRSRISSTTATRRRP